MPTGRIAIYKKSVRERNPRKQRIHQDSSSPARSQNYEAASDAKHHMRQQGETTA